MAVNGPATSQHIGFEMLKRAAKIDLAFVPFQGGAPAVNALLGQHVDSLFSNYPTAAGAVSNGKLRALAVGSRARIEPMPDLPTIAESGYKDYEEDVWFGVVAPARTPKECVAQLAAWFAEAVQAPYIKSKLAAQELYSVGLCGERLRRPSSQAACGIRPHHSRGEHQVGTCSVHFRGRHHGQRFGRCMRRAVPVHACRTGAWSQARTIRIVVPFPAGGSADILARLLGEHIAKNQGPSVVVENRPGGGASIAYEAVARAAPDGNTLVINGNSIVINPHLRKVNYDPITSFEPVCYLLSARRRSMS